MTTTARLLASLDLIRYEVTRMDTAVADAKGLAREDRSTLKREIAAPADRTDKLIEWLSGQRLEAAKN